MRQRIAQLIDVVFSAALFFTVFIAPLKFGMPSIEINKVCMPVSRIEWIVSAWPNELCVLLIALVAVLYCLRALFMQKLELNLTPVDFPLIVFCAATVVSALFSIDKNASALGVGQLLGAAFLFHVVVNTPEKRGLIVIALVSAATIVSLYGIYQCLGGMEETKQWAYLYFTNDPAFERVCGKLASGRVFSTFVYPNALAGYLLTTIPLTVMVCMKRFSQDAPEKRIDVVRLSFILAGFCSIMGLFLFEKNLVSIKCAALVIGAVVLSIISPVAQAAALVLSHSYGGMVVFALVILFVLYMRDRTVCLKAAIGLGCLLFAGACYLLLCKRNDFVGACKLMSVKVRLEYFWSTLVMMAHRPFFGFGPGTYGDVFARFKLFGGEETQFAHNNYLQVCAESGIFAGICIVLFWIIAWLRGFYILKQNNIRNFDTAVRVGAFLGLTGFLLHGCIDFDLYIPAVAINVFVLTAFIFQDEGRKAVFSTKGFWRKVPVLIIACGLLYACMALYQGRLQAVVWFKKGMEDFQKGRFTRALPSFEKAARLDRSSALYHYQMGVCHERMGSPQEAIPCFKAAVARNRSVSRFHYALAKCYFQAGGYEKIVESELRKAVFWYPKSTFYRTELAKYFEIVGQKEKALLEYRTLYRIDPSHEEAARKIEELEQGNGSPEEE